MNALTVVAACVVTAGLVALLWRVSQGLYSSPVLLRSNYRGHEIPVAAGAVIVWAVLVVGATAHLGAAALDLGWEQGLGSIDRAVVVALGFGFLGLLDDLVGGADRRGFRGHVGAALHGELTTGFVKLAGGVALGIVAVRWGTAGSDPVGRPDLVDLVRGGLLVAAVANLGNLFDRAPGRVVKVSLVGLAVVVACGASASVLAGPAILVAAGLGLVVPDLRERCMLGDTGSNVLGAGVGLGLVGALGPVGQWVALGVAVALNLVSERVSFSAVIDRTPPLRRLDRLGSRRGR